MAIASATQRYLEEHAVTFDTVSHPRSYGSMTTAQMAHVPGDRFAKSVVLHDGQGYVLAVVPATHRIDLAALGELVGRRLSLASEQEIGSLFL